MTPAMERLVADVVEARRLVGLADATERAARNATSAAYERINTARRALYEYVDDQIKAAEAAKEKQ